jgi:hypothetical protein
MKIYNKSNFIKVFLCLFFALYLVSCGPLAFKRSDVKDNPINDAEKRKKNIEEGRGFTLGGSIGNSGNGNFSFANSNELWRATLEVLDFTPLSNIDYSGGLIITEWYSSENNPNESVKISVQFLSDEIRADGIDIKIFQKNCANLNSCTTKKISTDLNEDIKLAILKRASELKIKKN